jgi:hypothetical protein
MHGLPTSLHATLRTSLRVCALTGAAALALAPGLGWAWGQQGHQAVGAIADQLLVGSIAEQQVRQILGGMTLRQAALWADCAKGVSSSDGVNFKYTVATGVNGSPRYPECTPFETPEEEARQIAFVARNWKQCGAAHDREYCHNQYHYTDVSDRHTHYAETATGANTHDVVHAIQAAMAVLRGEAAPAPFQIADPREALLVLSHYVGDIHQPLHVASAYLDLKGRDVDPDAPSHPAVNETNGGNLIFVGATKFHAEWDQIPTSLAVDGNDFATTVAKARVVQPTGGDQKTWSETWATDTIKVGKVAFEGLSFAAKPTPVTSATRASTPSWTVSGIDSSYRMRAASLKGDQLAKAGARLAQALKAVWPDEGTRSGSDTATTGANCPPLSSQPQATGYLAKAELPDVKVWLPAPPELTSKAQAADDEGIRQSRALLKQARGMQAALDDVFTPDEIAQRFKVALGAELNHCNAPRLTQLIRKAQSDASALLSPIKRPVDQGGRPRPFVAKPKLATCLSPIDLAGKRHEDIDVHHLDRSGSYPSTHALVGMFVGMLMTDLAPERSAAMLSWGMEFGQSRVVCGFHYPSDVTAGRLAAAALWARLQASDAFTQDLQAAKDEVQAARGATLAAQP